MILRCLQTIGVLFFVSRIIYAGLLDWAPWLPSENKTKCYDDLGCLNITRSWYNLIHRPINVFPLPRNVTNTTFVLYTRDNPNKGIYLKVENEKSFENLEFNPNKSTKFIVHGFIDTPSANWVKDMKDEFIKVGDMNVIVVDWTGGSLPLYTQATANTRLVGLEIAHLINYLIKKYDMDPGNVHIIGHSLGAHSAGYAGALVPGLGRITGLDPAGLYFEEMPPEVRLDPTDAKFVDVIHTDGGNLGYGISQPCGHLDFYPNNGKEQPGCDITQTALAPMTLLRDGLNEASRILVACNHNVAVKLFIDSINTQCPYIGHQCSSYEQFKAGECFTCEPGSANCAVMGYRVNTTAEVDSNEVSTLKLSDMIGNKYYLITGQQFPYCRRLYRVRMELAKPKVAESWVQGFINATLYSSTGEIHVALTPSNDTKLEHGTTFTSMVSHPADLGGNIKKVELSWEYKLNESEPKTNCILWCNDHLYVESVSVEQMVMPEKGKTDAPFSNKLCPKDKKSYSDIANKGKGVFVDSCT